MRSSTTTSRNYQVPSDRYRQAHMRHAHISRSRHAQLDDINFPSVIEANQCIAVPDLRPIQSWARTPSFHTRVNTTKQKPKQFIVLHDQRHTRKKKKNDLPVTTPQIALAHKLKNTNDARQSRNVGEADLGDTFQRPSTSPAIQNSMQPSSSHSRLRSLTSANTTTSPSPRQSPIADSFSPGNVVSTGTPRSHGHRPSLSTLNPNARQQVMSAIKVAASPDFSRLPFNAYTPPRKLKNRTFGFVPPELCGGPDKALEGAALLTGAASLDTDSMLSGSFAWRPERKAEQQLLGDLRKIDLHILNEHSNVTSLGPVSPVSPFLSPTKQKKMRRAESMSHSYALSMGASGLTPGIADAFSPDQADNETTLLREMADLSLYLEHLKASRR